MDPDRAREREQEERKRDGDLAAEIAQRGIRANFTFIDTIPNHSLTYLNILSETITSYVAVGIMPRDGKMNGISAELLREQRHQRKQLFISDSPFGGNLILSVPKNVPPLLEEDSFLFLSSGIHVIHPGIHNISKREEGFHPPAALVGGWDRHIDIVERRDSIDAQNVFERCLFKVDFNGPTRSLCVD